MQNASGRGPRKAVPFLSALCVLLLAVSLVNAQRANRYRAQLLHTANQSLSQLCTQLDTVRTALQKGSYATSEPMLSRLSAAAANAAAGAKLTLSQLTTQENAAPSFYRFLSQSGDFANALCSQLRSGKPLTQKQQQSLRALSAYADKLCTAMDELRRNLDDDLLRFETPSSALLQQAQTAPSGFDDTFLSASQTLGDPPALQYDGPFSDTRQPRTAKALAGLEEITPQTARSRAAKYLGCAEQELVRESDEDSALALYRFSKGARTVGLSKRGGLLCELSDAAFAGKSEISADAAARIARSYLGDIGYKGMKEVGRSTYDGICTLRFAYSENGVTYDADRITVSVALDRSVVVAVDARPYLLHHTTRSLPEKAVSLKDAVRGLSDRLDLLDAGAAVIERDDGSETLCHALHCRDRDGKEVFIYADSTKPEEADIRLVTRDDDGMLAK